MKNKKIAIKIKFDKNFIFFVEEDEKKGRVEWYDINKILIETNDSGPLDNDLNFIISTLEFDVYISGELSGTDELLKIFQSFSNFNNAAVIEAVSSIESKLFLLWEKD
jgi:hypothetical protein